MGVDFDRSLTYETHIRRTCQKVKTPTNLIQRIFGVGWGANANTFLRTFFFFLVIAPAEYCYQSFIDSTHVAKIDVHINCVLTIICESVKSTSRPWFPVMSNIASSELRRLLALNKLYSNCDESKQSLLYNYKPPSKIHRFIYK